MYYLHPKLQCDALSRMYLGLHEEIVFDSHQRISFRNRIFLAQNYDNLLLN